MSSEIQVYQKTRELLKSQDVKDRFTEILGDTTRANAFLASILSVVFQDDNLKECDPQSILYAAMKAAVLDLPVDPNIGQSAIIPYKGRASFQIMYKGIIQLALRTGQYLIINVTEVYEGEEIREDRLTGEIKLNGKRISDVTKGVVGYFKLKNGFQHYLYMSNEDLEAHGKKYSPSYKYDTSLWHKDPKSMFRKTIVKQMLTKYGLLSIDLKQALAEDDNEIVEAEVRDITQPEPEHEQEKKQPAARKPKEEKVAEPASEVPFVQEATSSGTSNDPPEPERPPEYNNPDTEPEIKAPAKLSPPEMLVQAGFFREVGLAKAALMWYKGSIEYEPLVAWAAKVQEGMKQGLPLAQAAKNASM